jgi:hypothetical protein
MHLRPIQEGDIQAVLALINADRLEGQPLCDAVMLSNACKGQASIDAGWWNKLVAIQTWVAVDTRDESIIGASSLVFPEKSLGQTLQRVGVAGPLFAASSWPPDHPLRKTRHRRG